MSDIFTEGEQTKKENVRMKSGEITGDQHLFHSLPKEFQTWHTVHYMLEREGDVDSNTIANATLNAYMWKTLFDGTSYGLMGILLVISTISIERLLMTIDSSILSSIHWIYFLGISIYMAYHFVFYGMIRAQVIGKLTEQAAKNTSIMFYQTSSAVFVSLIIAFLFTVSIGEDVQRIIFLSIIHYGESGFGTSILVIIHNIINWFIYFKEDSLISNIYIWTVLFSAILVFFCWFVERHAYKKIRSEVIDAMSKAALEAKFPIEKSQSVMKAWRKKHGV